MGDLGTDGGGPQHYMPPYFSASSVVKADGTAIPTILIDNFTLLAIVPSTMLDAEGPLPITVTTGGNTSSPTPLAVVTSGNPLPTVSSISPSIINVSDMPMGGLTVTGTNFVAGARIYLGAVDVTDGASVVSPTEVDILYVPFEVRGNTGSYPVMVQNPAPGGGASTGSLTLTVQEG